MTITIPKFQKTNFEKFGHMQNKYSLDLNIQLRKESGYMIQAIINSDDDELKIVKLHTSKRRMKFFVGKVVGETLIIPGVTP